MSACLRCTMRGTRYTFDIPIGSQWRGQSRPSIHFYFSFFIAPESDSISPSSIPANHFRTCLIPPPSREDPLRVINFSSACHTSSSTTNLLPSITLSFFNLLTDPKMHQPMFPANGSLIINGTPNGAPKAFSDDTKIIGYDPVIMPALIQAELPLVRTFW